MITSFFTFFYTISSLVVILLLSIVLQANSGAGYAFLFGIFVVPVSVLLGIGMITFSYIEKKYPSDLIFQLIGLFIAFIILTPLSSYIILSIKDIHENERYGIPFIIIGLASFIPAVLKIILLTQESNESQLLNSKSAFFVAATLYVLTMFIMFFVPNE